MADNTTSTLVQAVVAPTFANFESAFVVLAYIILKDLYAVLLPVATQLLGPAAARDIELATEVSSALSEASKSLQDAKQRPVTRSVAAAASASAPPIPPPTTTAPAAAS